MKTGKTGVRVHFPTGNDGVIRQIVAACMGTLNTACTGAPMPRQPRLDLANIPQHVVQRGNDRQPCFFTDVDRVRYLQDLREIAIREGCNVHAYVLMTNHVHLLMTPAASGQVARVMQSLGRRYVRYINDRYRRTGTLWEGRYKSSLVDRETYLLHCYRYIELNPIRAHMTADPLDYT
jgi:putative transposase